MSVTIDDIRAAAARLAPVVRRTPLLTDDFVNEQLGARLYLKAECLQRFGSFKLRGAYNTVAQLEPDARKRGVVAFSSGNHAAATAAAARMFGVPAVIVMPADAPAAKLAQTRALGAEVVTYDRATEDREAIGAALAAERGLAMVKPFDDARVIAGQGTVGLEIVEDLAALGVTPDIVLACASGGGLAAGVAVAVKAQAPDAKVYPVEPVGHDDLARSLAAGARVANAPGVRSIADALLVATPGEIPFEIGRRLWAGALSVSDDEILDAMALGFQRFRLVIEPGGAAALAAVLSGKVDVKGKTVVVVASGGGVDTATFSRALARLG
ncbi:MAG: threonine/serine dehydratase [Alphaproteobacteria bacterium]|nr:threonine/serine dehydratase [Alphaproteobacteria bacterium]